LSRFVLDASVALSWFFEDEESAYADSVFDALESFEAVVPGIWPLEIANALAMAERRGRVSTAQSDEFLKSLAALPIVVSAAGLQSTFQKSLPLGRAHRLTVYDASYVGLSIEQGLPLATIDAKLNVAAGAMGVPVFQPVRLT
jgi:predicted nucleic acid-binding protein